MACKLAVLLQWYHWQLSLSSDCLLSVESIKKKEMSYYYFNINHCNHYKYSYCIVLYYDRLGTRRRLSSKGDSCRRIRRLTVVNIYTKIYLLQPESISVEEPVLPTGPRTAPRPAPRGRWREIWEKTSLCDHNIIVNESTAGGIFHRSRRFTRE